MGIKTNMLACYQCGSGVDMVEYFVRNGEGKIVVKVLLCELCLPPKEIRIVNLNGGWTPEVEDGGAIKRDD